MAAMVNMSSLLNGKDSRWLQLEVCREFQRNKCSRPDTECKFAHPPANVEVQNGRVTACYDSIKGRCNREKPPCKYFHPPQHLKDQLLINGRNHLALKNALMQQMGMAPPTPQPAIIPSPMQQMPAQNRYLGGVPTNNPYNPYYAAGLLPQMMGHEHGTAQQLAQCVPQGMTLAQPQKIQRNDRIQVSTAASSRSTCSYTTSSNTTSSSTSLLNATLISAAPKLSHVVDSGKKRPAEHQLQMDHMNKMGSYYYENFNFPGMMPYKRPAQDKQPGISIYQPTAAAYQQLMQLQQQPSFVPVSCEYTSNQSHASANTIYPNTSTAIPNNNLHHHLILNSQTSINNSSNENNNNLKLAHNNNNNINSIASNVYNNTVTSTANAAVAAVAAAQNKIATAQQQYTANAAANILYTSPSKSINNNAIIDDDTSVAIVQAQAKMINSGIGTDDEPNLNHLNDNNTLETKPEISLSNDHIDEETTPLSIDKINSNAIGMTASLAANSTAAVSMHNAATNVTTAAAVANTININNSILSRKNATPNQPHLLNHNISSNNNSSSSKVINPANKMQDNMQELMSVSQLNNSQAAAQAALLSAVLNNQPYHQQQLGMPQSHNLYADPAQMAKEVAQKNYANALKMAVAQQNSHMAGKPLTAMSYPGLTLNNTPSMYPQQPGSSHPRMPTAIAPSRAPMHFSAMQRPMQNPYQQFIRPQMTPVNMQAANQYYAAAAHQQFLNQQNFLYSGLAHGAMNPQLAVTSTASQPTHMTSAYPYAYSQAQAMNVQGMQTSMMQVPQMAVPPSAQTQGNGSAVVLNPYKKMKTS
ncbi:unnamed protein product [Diamesa serratosioi]